MRTYTPDAGEHILSACKKLVNLANAHDESVQMKFNAVSVVAQPGMAVKRLAETWQNGMNQMCAEYREKHPSGTDLLNQLLEIHPNIVIQKWAGNREFPYEIRLGCLNRWSRGKTISAAIEEALTIDPRTIKGTPGEKT